MDVEAISRGILDRFQSDLGWATNGSENARPHDAEAVAIISTAIRTATARVEAERDEIARSHTQKMSEYLVKVGQLRAERDAARVEVAKLRGLLCEVQFCVPDATDRPRTCPLCYCPCESGHATFCRLAAALAPSGGAAPPPARPAEGTGANA